MKGKLTLLIIFILIVISAYRCLPLAIQKSVDNWYGDQKSRLDREITTPGEAFEQRLRLMGLAED